MIYKGPAPMHRSFTVEMKRNNSIHLSLPSLHRFEPARNALSMLKSTNSFNKGSMRTNNSRGKVSSIPTGYHRLIVFAKDMSISSNFHTLKTISTCLITLIMETYVEASICKILTAYRCHITPVPALSG